jgi:hypothetical protein
MRYQGLIWLRRVNIKEDWVEAQAIDGRWFDGYFVKREEPITNEELWKRYVDLGYFGVEVRRARDDEGDNVLGFRDIFVRGYKGRGLVNMLSKFEERNVHICEN